MKARSTIAELDATALPIFGDPDREYDYLLRVTGQRAVAGGIEAAVESAERKRATARLVFVTPEVLRVQYVLDREPAGTTPMLAGPLPAPPGVTVEEVEGAVELSAGALRLRLEARPFRWALLDREGGPLAAQEVHDGPESAYVSFPAGWSWRASETPAFHETLALRPDEQLFGLGESFGRLNRRGSRAVAWSRDTYGATTTPLTYLNVPLLLSTRGYGVFINHTARIVYELGYPSQVATSFRVEQPYLDYFVIAGPEPKAVLARYWALTGRGALPPLWSFGVWMSRCMYRDAEQVRGVVTRLRELGIPVDVVNIDPRWLTERKHRERDACDFVWDREAFGEPEAFASWLRERDVRLCLWENPYVWRGTALYKEAQERGYLATLPDGGPASSLDGDAGAGVVDFTNPAAASWWQDHHRSLLRAGVSAFKTDYGEGVPEEARFSDGTTGLATHNVLPLLYNRAVWEVIEEERGEAVVFGRSGYAGSQRYPLNWVGDTQCTWAGMASALRAGLSLSASGIPFWSHDIGGFWNPENAGQGPDPELYIRWAQWGLLSSHARFHGVRGREPWWFGDEAIDVVRRFALLRSRLLPYLWSCANESVATAMPLARPLFLEYPDDPTTYHIDTQYLLGPWLLVAPVFEPGGRARVYLPAGRWYDFWSGESVDGARWLSLTVPLDRLPLYVREDSLLPFGPEMTHVGERRWAPLEVDVRVASSSSFAVEGEGAQVRVEARRAGDRVELELSGSAELALRFRAPAAVAAEATGDVSNVYREREGGSLTLRFGLAGKARVEAG
jgi:alpha-D-xyloside xylohydrolase